MMLAKDHKQLRFSCLTKAYQEALENFDLLSHLDFGLIKKKTEGLDRYKKLNWLAKHSIKIFKENTDEKFWAAYKLQLEEAVKNNPGFSYKSNFENDHVNYAIRNAFFAYFALVNLIPKLYKRQFGREIEPALYRETVFNTLPFLNRLSKFHFDVFRAFLYASTQKDHGVNPELHVFKLDLFKFETEGENLILDLTKRAYLKIKEESEKIAKKGKLRTHEPTIGCPAIHVSLPQKFHLLRYSRVSSSHLHKVNSDSSTLESLASEIFSKDSGSIDLIEMCFYWVTETLDRLEFYDSALAPYSSSPC